MTTVSRQRAIIGVLLLLVLVMGALVIIECTTTGSHGSGRALREIPTGNSGQGTGSGFADADELDDEAPGEENPGDEKPGDEKPVDVDAPGRSVDPATFSISGDLAHSLAPGRTGAIDVAIVNPYNTELIVTGLVLTLQSVTVPRATSSLPCSTADFTTTQIPDAVAIAVPANSTRSLSQLGIPSSQWPSLRMLLTVSNQDGCKGASLSLGYSAAGSID